MSNEFPLRKESSEERSLIDVNEAMAMLTNSRVNGLERISMFVAQHKSPAALSAAIHAIAEHLSENKDAKDPFVELHRAHEGRYIAPRKGLALMRQEANSVKQQERTPQGAIAEDTLIFRAGKFFEALRLEENTNPRFKAYAKDKPYSEEVERFKAGERNFF